MASATSGTAIAVPAPAGASSSDVVVIIANLNNSAVTLTDNNGATPFTIDLTHNLAGGTEVFVVMSRRLQAGDPTTYNFTVSDSDRWVLEAVAFQNPDPSTIYDVAPASGHCTDQTVNGTTSTAPSITTTTNGSIWCAIGAPDGVNTVITPPGGSFTTQQNGGSQAASFSTQPFATAGATGTAAYTWGASTQSVCASFAVKNNPTSPSASSLLLQLSNQGGF
jgi:hypothetical protein